MSSSRGLLMLVSTVIALAFVLNCLPPWTIVHQNRNSDLFRRRYDTQLERSGDHGSRDPNEFASLYLTNLDLEVSEEMLREMFSGFGKITSLIIVKDFKGESRGFAFIDFETAADARRAMKRMNGRRIGSKVLCVERVPTKEEGRDKPRSWF